MRLRAASVGGIALLAAAALATVAWFARPVKALRYAGAGGGVEATVSLRVDGVAPPEQITIELGPGARLVAHRLP